MLLEDLAAEFAAVPQFGHLTLFGHRHTNADAPFHADLIEAYWGAAEQFVALCFRDAAKSTLAEECLILGALTQTFRYAVIVCATERRATDRLLAIKHELETNEVIEEVFGDQRGEVWQQARIILANGVCIDAIGAGQNTRGMKYLNHRPEFAFIDDLEEMNQSNDNVSTPERREELARWFRAFIPSLAQPHKIRMAGTMLHAESLLARCIRSESWASLVVPIVHLDAHGNRVAAWPDKFPLAWIDRARAEAEAEGQLETFAQEYMCQASSPQAHAFKEEHFRFDDRPHTWEPTYIIYDPARTVGPKSCATGKIAASWVNNRLLVWEATQAFWQPDELIADIFKANEEYEPIEIGVEETGLNQFIMQPLRQAQISRGSIPLRALNPPRGPGKETFLLRLQPFFAAGEIIFMGPRAKFQKLIDELLGFPYGRNDTINALAYMLEIRPGEPMCDIFTSRHVIEQAHPPQWTPKHLLLNSDGRDTVGLLVSFHDERLTVIADWHAAGAPGHAVPAIAMQARAMAGLGPLPSHAPPDHFKPYDTTGLPPAARSAGLNITQGGAIVQGRDELRKMMVTLLGQEPTFQVSKKASWTLRALSGGYAKEPGKMEAAQGPYRLIGEALESFAASAAAQMGNAAKPNAVTADGRPYFSAMPHRAGQRKPHAARGRAY